MKGVEFPHSEIFGSQTYCAVYPKHYRCLVRVLLQLLDTKAFTMRPYVT